MAEQSYDPSKGSFPSFASTKIKGQILHYLRDESYSGHVRASAYSQELLAKVKRLQRLLEENGREMDLSEVGQRLLGNQWNTASLALTERRRTIPLSAVDIEYGEDSSEDEDVILYLAIAALTEEQQRLVRDFFFSGRSLRSLAKSYNTTPDEIEMSLEIAIDTLREVFLSVSEEHGTLSHNPGW